MVLQNHTGVKDPFKAQDRPMDFSVTEYEKFMNMVSDSAVQLTFKKVTPVAFWYSINEGCAHVSKSLLKGPSLF